MNDRARPDGRLRALYAVAAGSLETASFAVKAVWLLCVLLLVAIIGGILAGLLNAIF
jgi:hypothetical protein